MTLNAMQMQQAKIIPYQELLGNYDAQRHADAAG